MNVVLLYCVVVFFAILHSKVPKEIDRNAFDSTVGKQIVNASTIHLSSPHE